MRKMLRIELSRAFRNRLFVAALLLGLVIAGMQVISWQIPILAGQNDYLEYPDKPMLFPYCSWYAWIGNTDERLESYLYFLLLPLMAVLPFADSYFTDRKIGYIKNVYTRTEKRSYILSKLMAVFLSGGAAVTLPLLLNLLVSMVLFPTYTPVASAVSMPHNQVMWGDWIYTVPGLYVGAFLLLIFVFAGFLALLSLALSFAVENRFVVLLGPFVLYLFLDALCSLLGYAQGSPMVFLNPGALNGGIRFELVLAETLAVGLIGGGIFVMKGIRDETY